MEIITKSISDAREWQQAQDQPGTHPTQPPLTPSRYGPTRPSPSTTVCNVDGAWDARTKNCGVGGVFSGWKD